MFKPVSRDFYLDRVADHELAAAECADPHMRQVWLATAAEWRQASQKPPARRVRARSSKRNDQLLSGSTGEVLAFAAGAGAPPNSQGGEQTYLYAGQLFFGAQHLDTALGFMLDDGITVALAGASALSISDVLV